MKTDQALQKGLAVRTGIVILAILVLNVVLPLSALEGGRQVHWDEKNYATFFYEEDSSGGGGSGKGHLEYVIDGIPKIIGAEEIWGGAHGNPVYVLRYFDQRHLWIVGRFNRWNDMASLFDLQTQADRGGAGGYLIQISPNGRNIASVFDPDNMDPRNEGEDHSVVKLNNVMVYPKIETRRIARQREMRDRPEPPDWMAEKTCGRISIIGWADDDHLEILLCSECDWADEKFWSYTLYEVLGAEAFCREMPVFLPAEASDADAGFEIDPTAFLRAEVRMLNSTDGGKKAQEMQKRNNESDSLGYRPGVVMTHVIPVTPTPIGR